MKIASGINRTACLFKHLAYRCRLLRRKKAPIPVISVGNIRFGGSEKTPLVMDLITFLRQEGMRPAMITRGYRGGWERRGGVLSNGERIHADWKSSGDEPYMVARRIPEAGIFVGRKRHESTVKASEMGFDIAVLDDGFQHLRLHRDLDIVLHDPEQGNPLRESTSSMRRADILLLKRGLLPLIRDRFSHRFPNVPIFDYQVRITGIFPHDGSEPIPPETLPSQRGVAFSGIANPERFLKGLNKVGINPIQYFEFPDHFVYPEKSRQKIRDAFDALRGDFLITTEKDVIKVGRTPEMSGVPLYYPRIALDIDEAFYSEIKKSIRK